MSLIHNAHSFLDGYLLQWTEETLKRQLVRLHSALAGEPKKHKPVEIKTNHLHPAFNPAFFPVWWVVLCISDHYRPTARDSGHPETPLRGPLPPKPPWALQKVPRGNDHRSILREERNYPLWSPEAPAEPLPFHVGTLELHHSLITGLTSTQGTTLRMNL